MWGIKEVFKFVKQMSVKMNTYRKNQDHVTVITSYIILIGNELSLNCDKLRFNQFQYGAY